MGILVGDCALKIEEHDERQAEIGSTLSRAYQGRGIASEGVSCVLEYAFVALELHWVIAITACENAASVTLLERLGLRREGHFLQNVWFKGKRADEYLYAMLQEEWRTMRRTNRPMEMDAHVAQRSLHTGRASCLYPQRGGHLLLDASERQVA